MSEWINIKDKIPEDDQFCLTYSSGGRIRVMKAWVRNGELSTWYIPESSRIGPNAQWWMPLPEPPEGSKKLGTVYAGGAAK